MQELWETTFLVLFLQTRAVSSSVTLAPLSTRGIPDGSRHPSCLVQKDPSFLWQRELGRPKRPLWEPEPQGLGRKAAVLDVTRCQINSD